MGILPVQNFHWVNYTTFFTEIHLKILRILCYNSLRITTERKMQMELILQFDDAIDALYRRQDGMDVL